MAITAAAPQSAVMAVGRGTNTPASTPTRIGPSSRATPASDAHHAPRPDPRRRTINISPRRAHAGTMPITQPARNAIN